MDQPPTTLFWGRLTLAVLAMLGLGVASYQWSAGNWGWVPMAVLVILAPVSLAWWAFTVRNDRQRRGGLTR